MAFSSTRRRLLAAAPALAAAPVINACARDESLPLPPDVPVGPFGKESTAEEVTAGLDLTGRTALVTGCNSGIGYETMRVLALRGAHVFGAARTQQKAVQACESVEGRTTPIVVELTELDTVVEAARQVRAESKSLDMLICNAGIMELPELEQVNGIEKQFFVNHIGHFVLVNRLLEPVVNAQQGRIVCVASGQALRNAPKGGIEFDNLSGEAGYDPALAYGQSKLANILFTLELSSRLEGTNATANSLMPGVIPTNLGRHMPAWKTWVLENLMGWLTKTIPQGAATTCYVATAPSLRNVSGCIFSDCNPTRPGGYTEDRDMAARLWSVSEEIAAGYV